VQALPDQIDKRVIVTVSDPDGLLGSPDEPLNLVRGISAPLPAVARLVSHADQHLQRGK
jgi:hypothetical protein